MFSKPCFFQKNTEFDSTSGPLQNIFHSPYKKSADP